MRRYLLLVAALGGALALGWAALGARSEKPPIPAVTQDPGMRGAPESQVDAGDGPTVALERLQRVRLPRPDADLTGSTVPARTDAARNAAATELVIDQLAELEGRAAAGDAVAACRVASLLAKCRGVARRPNEELHRRMLDDARERARQASGERKEHMEQRVRMIESDLHWMQRCAGVDGELLALQPWIDVRAAKLGDVGSAQRFVSGQGIAVGNLLTDPALAQFYRDNAWPLFLDMFRSGEEAAVWIWAEALSRRSDTLFWSVLPEDWRDQQVLYGLINRIMVRREPGWELSDLNPAGTIGPEADGKAEALWAQYFRDVPPAGQSPGRSMMLRPPPERDEDPEAHCVSLAGDGEAARP